MKKALLLIYLVVVSVGYAWSQCIFTCSNYNMSAITYSQFAVGGTTVNSLFTPTADDGTVNVPIGFNFNYYCNTYSAVNICTNGFIQLDYGTPISFGTPPYVNPTQSFPDMAAPNGLIALRMDDFDVTTTGAISYTTVGTAPNRMFIVTYDNVPIWYNAATNSPPFPVYTTGQIVLYETTNIIEIHSGDIDLSPNTCTQGIEDINGINGLSPAGWNSAFWSTTSTAYRFAPYTPAPPSAVTGNTNVCEGTLNAYATVPMAGATSYNWSLPPGWSGTSSVTALTAGAGVSGNVSVTATYSCGVSVPATLAVNVTPAPTVAIASAAPMALCSGNTFTITAAGGTSYSLYPGNYSSNTGSFVITGNTATTYSLVGTNTTNCVSFNPASVFIDVFPSPTITVNSGTICVGQGFTMSPSGASQYFISGGFGIVIPGTLGVHNYTISGVAANNCPSQVPAICSITVNPNPTITITPSRPAICKNESAVLTAGGASTYFWVNNSLTTNTILVSPLINTAYTVTGTSADGCTKSKTFLLPVFSCVGVEELSAAGSTGAMVYPNPSAGQVNIRFNGVYENAVLELYDATGKLLMTKTTGQAAVQFDLSGQAAGLYYLKIRNDGTYDTIKLVKE